MSSAPYEFLWGSRDIFASLGVDKLRVLWYARLDHKTSEYFYKVLKDLEPFL